MIDGAYALRWQQAHEAGHAPAHLRATHQNAGGSLAGCVESALDFLEPVTADWSEPRFYHCYPSRLETRPSIDMLASIAKQNTIVDS